MALALAAVLVYVAELVANARKEKRQAQRGDQERALERKHKLELEQQRTYQLDLVKGDLQAYEQLRKIE